MSLPYQRTSESTRSSASSYFAGSHTPPTSHSSPTWKGSKKAARVNTRRLLQYLGAIAGTVLVFSLISGLFGNSKIRYDVGPSRDGRLNKNHLVDFEGALDCRISSTELYVPPKHDTPAARKAFPYCKDRKTLLDALNSGGRHGFDEPFTPKGCHYKWYSPFEICMIMDRFDGFIFVGDEMIHNIYAAFNVLLRQDMSLGAMESWKMSEKERNECRCEKQFTNPECRQYMVKNSRSVQLAHFENGYKDPYVCNRIPHFYFDVRGSPAPDEHKKEFQDLLDADPHSWKPVATVHSLGLSTGFDWSQATNSLDEWLTIADNSGRNTPFLWLNPNAAGHLKPPAKIMQEGNNALWHYTIEMGKESIYRGIEHLDMYNNTLQATSWDGTSYGERVSLVQAMEIINWFARLETT